MLCSDLRFGEAPIEAGKAIGHGEHSAKPIKAGALAVSRPLAPRVSPLRAMVQPAPRRIPSPAPTSPAAFPARRRGIVGGSPACRCYGMMRAMPTPVAMKRLGELREQLQRVERVRQRLVVGQPITTGDVMLLVDRARDAITGEMRHAKARLRAARAG